MENVEQTLRDTRSRLHGYHVLNMADATAFQHLFSDVCTTVTSQDEIGHDTSSASRTHALLDGHAILNDLTGSSHHVLAIRHMLVKLSVTDRLMDDTLVGCPTVLIFQFLGGADDMRGRAHGSLLVLCR